MLHASVVITLLACSFVLQARETHPLGWSFSTPQGWRVRHLSRVSALAPPDRDYDLSRADQGHLYLITAFDDIADVDADDLAWRFRRTLAHNGVEPVGTPTKETLTVDGRRTVLYTWTFQTRRRAVFLQTRLYLVPDAAHKVTLALLAMSERDLLGPKDAEIRQIVSSMTFTPGKKLGVAQWGDWGYEREEPPGPGMPDPGDVLADESVPSQQWFFYLKGKRLAPVPGRPTSPASKAGPSLELRQDGTFVGGRWRIVTRAGVTALVLYWKSADPTYHRLERRDNAILIDDVPTTVTR